MGNNFQISNSKGLKLSTHTVVKLTDNELDELQQYVKTDAAYINIKNNTGVCFATIKRVEKSGEGRIKVIVKLRDFLRKIKAGGLSGKV